MTGTIIRTVVTLSMSAELAAVIAAEAREYEEHPSLAALRHPEGEEPEETGPLQDGHH